MQMNGNQSMQGGGGGISGRGLLQPLALTQPQQQQSNTASQRLGNASTGWSSNIDSQSHQGLGGMGNNQTIFPYGGGGAQSHNQPAGGSWSSNIATGSSNSKGSGTGVGGWSQGIAQRAPGTGMGHSQMQSGMGMQQMQGGSGMGQSSMQMQGGMGMGHTQMQGGMGMGRQGGGGPASWSSNIAGGGNIGGGYQAPPTGHGMISQPHSPHPAATDC